MGAQFPLVDAESTQDRGHLFLLLFADVAVIVEVTEEDDEGDTVTEHQHIHGIREIALCEQVVASVQEEQHKLHLERAHSISLLHKQRKFTFFLCTTAGAYQLQRCEISLPPQVLLHVRANGGQAVVRIHHNVDKGVHQADEECCSLWTDRGAKVQEVQSSKGQVSMLDSVNAAVF